MDQNYKLMKRTFTINLSGIVFHIDDDAYSKLQSYLDSISSKYMQTPDGQEIINDIEARIAELCQAKLSPSKQVITIEDVIDVIGILGEPQEFEFQDETFFNEPGNEEKTTSKEKYRTGKHVYRDPDNRLIGGVAAGLAAYFGVDVVIVRVVFVVTFLLFGPLLYLALWIIIPEASTVAQKLEMHGEPVNISNIEKAVRDEWFEVKKSFDRLKKKDGYKKFEQAIDSVFQNTAGLLKPIFIFTMLATALTLLVIVLVFVLNIAGSTVFSADFFNRVWDLISSVPFPNFSGSLIDPWHFKVLLLGAFILVALPLLGVVIAILKAIVGIQGRHWFLGFFFVLGISVGLSMIIYVGIAEGKHFKAYNERIEEYSFAVSNDKHLTFGLTEDLYDNPQFRSKRGGGNDRGYYFDPKNFGLLNDEFMVTSNEGLLDICVAPSFDIYTTKEDSAFVRVVKTSQGENMRDAAQNILAIEYYFQLSDSLLLFDPMFAIDHSSKWRAQQMDIEVYLPKGTELCFSKEFSVFFHGIDDLAFHKYDEIISTNWIVTDSGLKSK